ncbi:TraR/DksA family transcriptional regulator [Micromonospora chersina]|uniref:TraR/DksA family transcriptional regulator n=1 Tax=Micromonospora chersina TaxID=47854 RepID=UPI003718AD4A
MAPGCPGPAAASITDTCWFCSCGPDANDRPDPQGPSIRRGGRRRTSPELTAVIGDASFARSPGRSAQRSGFLRMTKHDPEGATIAFERAQVAVLLAGARRRLAELDAALERLDAGRYGRCERCGLPIPAERLAVRPSARTCVSRARSARQL